MKFSNIDQVWEAIQQGKTVYWSSKAYALTVEPVNREWRQRCGFEIPFSARGESCLRVTCISNYFGSLLEPHELGKLFVEENNGAA